MQPQVADPAAQGVFVVLHGIVRSSYAASDGTATVRGPPLTRPDELRHVAARASLRTCSVFRISGLQRGCDPKP